MNSALHFAKMDMLSFKPYRKYLLMLPLAILAVFEPPLLSVQLLIFFMLTSLSPYLFASEDKNAMHRLYALLPISNKDIVWGRYLCCIMGGLAYILMMALALFACSMFVEMSFASIVYSLISCTGLFLFSTAIQFPIFFKVGFIKGKFAALAPSFILLGIIFTARQLINFDLLSSLSLLGALNSILLLAIGMLAIILSVRVSIRLYQSREK